MPYNLDLEKRLDALSLELGSFDKKKMFGGIGYMSNGNMAFGIHKQNLILRIDPDKSKKLIDGKFIKVFDITGRPMAGWLMVVPEAVADDAKLSHMLKLAVNYVQTLPKK